MTSAVPAQPNISIFRVTSILVKQLHPRIPNVHSYSMRSRIHLPSKASYYDSTKRFSPSCWTNLAHGPLCWSSKDRARRNVELTAVARARHSGTVQLTLCERARSVRTCVIEGMKLSVNTRNVHLRARNVKGAHLSRNDISCVSNWHQHSFDLS